MWKLKYLYPGYNLFGGYNPIFNFNELKLIFTSNTVRTIKVKIVLTRVKSNFNRIRSQINETNK